MRLSILKEQETEQRKNKAAVKSGYIRTKVDGVTVLKKIKGK